MDVEKTGRYVIRLIRAALLDEQPDEKPFDISFEDVYAMARRHHVRNICFSSVKKLKEQPDKELMDLWKNYRDLSFMQGQIQLDAKDQIIAAFIENGIRCIPLKGCVLKEMYPSIDCREMADLDIFADRIHRAEIRDIMESLGFTCEKYGGFKDDSYIKPPYLHVEIHYALLSRMSAKQYKLTGSDSFLMDPFKSAECTNDSYVYRFTPENFYIYDFVHLAVHYSFAGIGIRHFTDLWVIKNKMNLEMGDISQVLRQMGLEQFHNDVSRLLDCWYGNGTLDENLKMMEQYVFNSGAFGNFESKVSNRFKRLKNRNPDSENNVGYFLYRLFPPKEIVENRYKFLEKRSWLLPVAWIHRWIYRLPKRKKHIQRELAVLRNKRRRKE